MCEPSQSIIQYSLEHEPVVRLIIPDGIKIGSFINYSALGYGHSEALGKIDARNLPQDYKYETHWWKREIRFDGDKKPLDFEGSFQSAEIYAHRSSIGDLKILRRFLETTILKSTHPACYIAPIFALLSLKGHQELERIIKHHYTNGKMFSFSDTLKMLLLGPQSKKRILGSILKLTRQQQFLSEVWRECVE